MRKSSDNRKAFLNYCKPAKTKTTHTHKKVRAQKDYAFATLRDALTYVYASRILFIKRLRSHKTMFIELLVCHALR
uniref:Transposase n=1 Tax=Panagrellus redivivus TaxID=6233 RepID=A0A7E4VD32_PANRE